MIRFYIFATEQIRERIVWFIKHFGQQTEIKICKEKNNDKFTMDTLNYYLIVFASKYWPRPSIDFIGWRMNTFGYRVTVYLCGYFCKIVLCKIMFLADKEKQNYFNILI